MSPFGYDRQPFVKSEPQLPHANLADYHRTRHVLVMDLKTDIEIEKRRRWVKIAVCVGFACRCS